MHARRLPHPAHLVRAGIGAVLASSVALHGAPWAQSVVSHGFNNSANTAITALTVFAPMTIPYLYAGTANAVEGARLYRSSDGVMWTMIGESGLLGSSNSVTHVLAPATLPAHGRALYFGTRNEHAGGELWRSTDSFSWVRCGVPGFGDARNIAIRAIAVFGEYLYVGTENPSRGAEIWRSSDNATWTPVMTGGFGNGATAAILCFAVMGSSYVLAGTSNAVIGGELWKSSDGVSWVRASDPGFGNAANTAISALAVFNDAVVAGTSNDTTGPELWYSSDTATWIRASAPVPTGSVSVATLFGYDNSPSIVPVNVGMGPGTGIDPAPQFSSAPSSVPPVFSGGYLYAGLAGGRAGIIRSMDGIFWGFPAADIFGSSGTTAVRAGTAFADRLYFATDHPSAGPQIHCGRLYRLSGTVADSGGNRVNNILITLTGPETRTTFTRYRYQTSGFRYDPGVFRFDNLLPGLYTLTPSHTGASFTPNSRPVGLYFDVEDVPFTISGSYPRYSLSGTVRDVRGIPQEGIRVILDDGAWSVTTGADGTYAFVQLDPGLHTVKPVLPSGTESMPPLREYPDLDVSAIHQDFIIFRGAPPPTYRIVGMVRDRFRQGIVGVTMHLSGMSSGTQVTDAAGRFAFENLPIGGYVLTPRKAGYAFTPENRTYLPLNADADAQMFHEATPASLDELVCAPNPVRADQGHTGAVFSRLPDRTTIRLYSLAGTLIRTIEKDDQTPYCTWDLRNDAWKPVSSGLYLYTITDGNGRSRSGRVVVIR